MRRLCLCDAAVSIRAARGAAAARRFQKAWRVFSEAAKTSNNVILVGRRVAHPAAAFTTASGGPAGFLSAMVTGAVADSLLACARARIHAGCDSFFAPSLSSSARRRRGGPPTAFLALFPARTAICAFGRWIMTVYGTLCSVLRLCSSLAPTHPRPPWRQTQASESGRPRNGHWGAARRRKSPRSTPGEKLALGQVHQSH